MRLAVDPDAALAALRRVVDPLDQVPGDGAAVRRAADARRPEPARVPPVVAGRLVVDAERLDVPAPPARLDRAADRDAGALAGPAPAAAAGADRLDGGAVAEPQARPQPARVDLEVRDRPSSPRGRRGGSWCGRGGGARAGPRGPRRTGSAAPPAPAPRRASPRGRRRRCSASASASGRGRAAASGRGAAAGRGGRPRARARAAVAPRARGKVIPRSRAARRGGSCLARGRPRRRRPSRWARSGGRSTPASRSVAMSLKASRSSRASIRAPRSAGRGSRMALSRTASREPWRRSSSAAVFGPTPFAPGRPSEGSPRRAMKSGTSSGPMP